jgi:hypothetical protein
MVTGGRTGQFLKFTRMPRSQPKSELKSYASAMYGSSGGWEVSKKKVSRVGARAGVSHAPSVQGPPRRAKSKAELREELKAALERTERERQEQQDDN